MWRILSASTFHCSPRGRAVLPRQAGGTRAVLCRRWHPLPLPQGAVGAFAVQVLQPRWAKQGPGPSGELLKGCFSLTPCRLSVKNEYCTLGSLQILK